MTAAVLPTVAVADICVAVMLPAVPLAEVGVVLLPLPPTGLAGTELCAVFPLFTEELAAAVVEAVPLAGAFKIFPTEAHSPASLAKSG